MDKQTFQKNYGVTRGRLNRLLEKAGRDGDRFELPGYGWFTVRKTGDGRTAPLEFLPESSEAEAAAVPPPSHSLESANLEHHLPTDAEIMAMSKDEAEATRKKLDAIKARDQLSSSREALRDEILAELLPELLQALSGLRSELEKLRLDAPTLDRLRSAMHKSTLKLEPQP